MPTESMSPSLGTGAIYRQRLRRHPSVQHLRAAAQARLPGFAFDSGDGGAGVDRGIVRNNTALDAMTLVPRYGEVTELPPADTVLFGQAQSLPIGIAPMGSPGVIWPGADRIMATAAQRAGVPFCLSTVSGITIEEAARLAPENLWVQMYRFPNNDHAIGFDMVARARAAGARALILTMDVPVRTTRPREVTAGIASPFHFTPRMVAQALRHPSYVRAFLREGIPRFASLMQYAPPGAGINEMARFAQREFTGTFNWTEVARYRDQWAGPLVLKGILHPADAEKAVALGVDAIQVSNHGGRQIEGLPATIEQLPDLVAAVNGRARVLFDSGVRGGLDVVRALSLGADFVFAGKAFLWSLGALGESGPAHALDLFADEIRSTMGQLGVTRLEQLRDCTKGRSQSV